MILNGVSVVASLMKRGEDPVLGRAELASMFNITKRDLVAARERTGCYSLTRYHLNQAAELLGVNQNAFVYRVTPSLLKTDGSGKAEVTGADAQAMGATSVDPSAVYRADVSTNPDTAALVSDLAGMAGGGEYMPKDVTDRLELVQTAAKNADGSTASALLGTFRIVQLVRYNAARITQLSHEATNLTTTGATVAGLLHLGLGLYGAFSTGVVLGSLRTFLSTGMPSDYNEYRHLSRWMELYGKALVGTHINFAAPGTRQNAKFDNVVDGALSAQRMYDASPFVSPYTMTVRRNFEDNHVSKALDQYIELFAERVSRRLVNEQLDVDALVERANKLLKTTPQLVRNQA